GDADDDNDGALDPADSDDNNPNVCSDVDDDTCDDCSSGTFNPANDGADFDGDGLCDVGDPDDDNDGVLDAADPDALNPNVCGDADADGCDDCSVGVDGFGPLPDNDPANDGPDADADGVCDAGDNCLAASNPDQSDADGDNIGDACEPTVTVFKQVINDHGGTLDPEDFTIDVAGTVNGAAVPSFRGDAGGTTIELDPGAYGVTENPIYADFYAATLSADCAGVIAIGDAKTCTIVNDDLDREQTSSRVESLSATLSDSGAGIRDVVSGEFVMTDQSSGAASLTLLLSHYEVDFQFKRRGSFEPADSVADTFDVNGTTVSYSCEYNIVSDLPGATDLYQSGDPVEFDETITVGYTCTLDNSLPNKGTLKVTGAGEIFGRPDFQYTLSPTFSVGPGGLD
nr:hypothetical protein [Acidobacteriota bacterium]NIM64306.1 hypothetical protein [Acidobacteriota bacterium]NIO60938.1 hypothetical protein [Acidobacteriota bacterium]NIQ87407.1 hypothetical protein [Acidobacteriota bacterium]NIT12592.1 hypothetical protein [Acidobacteriota bacterium]